MNKSVIGAFAAAMTLSLAVPAFAAPVTASGNVSVSQSVSLGCSITLAGDRSTAGAVTTITLNANGVRLKSGDLLCPAVALTGTWTATYSGTGAAVPVSITNVGANSLTGTCGPATISGSYNTSTNVLTIPVQSIPGSPSACNLGGSLTVT